MTSVSDIESAPETPVFSSILNAERPLDEDAGPVSLYQEINERRARIENAELLQNLRSL
ncbi:MAG: hypothetical protein ACREE0_13910 [Phenylobacterium sp.]